MTLSSAHLSMVWCLLSCWLLLDVVTSVHGNCPLCQVVKTMSKEEIPCQVFVRVLKKKPGMKETNFQVSKHTGPPRAGLWSRSDGFCSQSFIVALLVWFNHTASLFCRHRHFATPMLKINLCPKRFRFLCSKAMELSPFSHLSHLFNLPMPSELL